jgi:CheY-like chemotaxis protein
VAVFRRAGADVRAVSSVRDGLIAVKAAPPRVVVCDLAMPDEDGFAFLRQIRALPGSSGTPVMALTAFGRPEDRQRAMSAGFDGYMKKPVDPAALASAVLQLAARRR